MKFTTKTEYGVICLIFLAKHSKLQVNPITIKQLANAEHFSVAYTEKILQTLRSANIVSSIQGNQGGYVLARPASEINLKEVIEALEGHTFDVFCSPDLRSEIICNHFSACGLNPIWLKTKELLDGFYQSITLAMLANNEIESDFSLAD